MNAVLKNPTSYAKQATWSAPAWFDNLRLANWQAYLAEGIPTRHDERWKYADLSMLNNKYYHDASCTISKEINALISMHRLPPNEAILLVCVNGFFIPELSDLQHIPAGMVICNLQTAMTKHDKLLQGVFDKPIDVKKYPFAASNVAQANDGIFIYQPKQCQLNLPIHLLSIVDDSALFISHPLHCFLIEDSLTLIEQYEAKDQSDYFINAAMHITLGENAQLKHYKIQHESKQATHIAHTFVNQLQDSSYALTSIATGAKFARDEIAISLNGKGANCVTGGFYCLYDDNQYIDYHIDIDHASPRTSSEMLYKGIVDKKSRAVFNGRLHVQKDAQKITAYQANHNLLISNQAEVYSKPELEIYADDVKCKHGATTGQLDQDALFYLRARGIDYQTAMSMLLAGFADEIINRIEPASLRARVKEML